MLAQNFMPAEALGITEEQHQALINTLAFFERGGVRRGLFNMKIWERTRGCGTAQCIAGWAEQLAGKDLYDYVMPPALQRLFFGDSIEGFEIGSKQSLAVMKCKDPAKGAHALRNYLTTGEPDWAGVLAG